MHWVAKRFTRSLATVFIVINLSFGMLRLLPGGPMDYLVSQLRQQGDIDQDRIEAIAQTYINVNPQAPLLDQYISYMGALASGDMGRSIWYDRPVAEILAAALPWTLFLMSLSVMITFALGVTLGTLIAYREGSNSDVATSIVSIVSNSIPYYIVAILFSFLFAHIMGWFPVTGKMSPETTPGVNWPFIVGVFDHATLPILSLVLTGFGGWALAMRGNSIRTLGEDYLRVARLRGIPSNRIATRYVGRNAILPMYTSLMISLGYLFGGSVVLEQIFVYRGVGFYLFKATVARDYPLMMGGFILLTSAVVIGIFLAELTYGKIDPRAREGGSDADVY